MRTESRELLLTMSRSADAAQASIADNCRFDERAAPERWTRFEALLPNPNITDWGDWSEANGLNMDKHYYVISSSVPDAFLDINQPAWLDGLTDNQTVVRLEALKRPLNGTGLTLAGFQDILARADSGKDADARQTAAQFFTDWNLGRYGCPAFAAFYDEVKDEADAADWPHALRDRLGLGHYGGGAPLPVALMKYSLAEVFAAQKARGLPTACTLPTVLDGGMHEFFFPVPREHPYGATLHLDANRADTLAAEILHCRIDYRREHLWKLGIIERPHQARDGVLRQARDLHLLSLREECKRGDFGEDMEGRT